MKKILSGLIILLLSVGLVFGATETADITLSATVAESPLNTGIKLRSGNLTSLFEGATNYPSTFATEFASSSSVNALMFNTGVDSAIDDAEGYFTILVQRTQPNTVEVSVNATPMQITTGGNSYLGYKIIGQWTPTLLISTIGSPNTPVNGITYQADRRPNAGAFVRDYRVFKYEIPKNHLAAVGNYKANVYFTITVD